MNNVKFRFIVSINLQKLDSNRASYNAGLISSNTSSISIFDESPAYATTPPPSSGVQIVLLDIKGGIRNLLWYVRHRDIGSTVAVHSSLGDVDTRPTAVAVYRTVGVSK